MMIALKVKGCRDLYRGIIKARRALDKFAAAVAAAQLNEQKPAARSADR